MKEWHIEHMEKTVLKYVKGLPENASGWERRNHKKYGGLAHICRQIEYDIRHGVTPEQVTCMFDKIRKDGSLSMLRKTAGSVQRLEEMESHFTKPAIKPGLWMWPRPPKSTPDQLQ